MGKKKGHKSKKHHRKGDGITLRGSFNITGIAATSSNPAVVTTTRKEIDTDLCTQWSEMAGIFQRWKIDKLVFQYKTLQGATAVGTVMMCMLEDPEAGTPTSLNEIITNRVHSWGPIWKNQRMVWKPRHNKFLFTKDVVLSEDRWEMPGDFIFGTTHTTSAGEVGNVICSFVVSFDTMSSMAVGSDSQLPPFVVLQKKINELERKGRLVKLIEESQSPQSSPEAEKKEKEKKPDTKISQEDQLKIKEILQKYNM